MKPNVRRRRIGEWLEPRTLLTGQPVISEFMADNNRTLKDGAGNSPDWIELYNAGDAALDLAGYHLTDDAADLDKWTFPSAVLDRGAMLVVFASGSGVPDVQGNLHTNFQLENAGEYLALVAPNGTTILSQFSPMYPPQREDVSYGATQAVTVTSPVAQGGSAKLLVPTAANDAAIGSTWTGGNEPFADGAWQSVQLGVGYDQDDPPPQPEERNVALNRPTMQSTNGFGFTGAPGTDGNRANLTHTNTGDLAPWWQTDLGGDFLIDKVDVYNRGDGCCQERHYNLRVEVRNASDAVVYTSAVFNPWNGSSPAAPPQPPSNLFSVDLSGQPGGGVTGAKVRVTKQAFSGSEWLSLGEVEVFSLVVAPPAQTNIALGKPVTASGPLWPGFPDPQRITDGNRSTFTHPETPVQTFSFTTDLGQTYSLDHINVVNRGDGCCTDRLSNYRVSLHTDDDGEFGSAVWSADVHTDGSNSGVGGVDAIEAGMDPSGQFAGRWVRIEHIDDGTAQYAPQIAEVEVFESQSYDSSITTDIESSLKNVNASAYLRAPFNVADPGQYSGMTFRVRDDDGFVAYLNGVEFARRNAPLGAPAYNAAATAEHFASAFEQFDVPLALLHAGQNILAVHGLNVSAGDSDFLLIPEVIAQSIATSTVGYFPDPTPGQPNGTSVQGFVADTQFDVIRGYFNAPLDVHITTLTPGATLVYTTDGTAPTLAHGTQVVPPDGSSSPVATVHVATTTLVRAAAFKTGFEPTNVDTQTYLFLNDVIHQPASPPGVPTTWNGFASDFEMDPDVVNNPAYSDEIVQGLRSIPTMSLVLDPDDLWGSTDGIYIYPERLGDAYERPVSIEVIQPDGSTLFQEDAGIRIWGTGWRPHSSTLKHAFQLKFKDIYGDTKLRAPLFPDAPVDEFDDIILRAQGSRGWTDFRTGGLEVEATQYIHDSWARDTARDMGKQEGHATMVHLYLNGLYWGLYNPVERPTGNFGEAYFGGNNDDYDVLSHRVGEPIVANEGDLVAWNQVMALSDAGLASDAAYAQIQQLVDVDNLIDYMLIQAYATNHDGPSSISGFGGNNMRVLRKREPGGQFRFYVWDMEYTFWNASENSNITDVDAAGTIGHLFTKLRDNAEFRQRFADRAHMHLTGDGALTPAKAAARWQARADEIYTAIIGESARWGDFRRPTNPYTRDVEWQAELNRLMTQYFPQRTAILLSQLQAANLYPSTPAPEFNQDGGVIPPGFNLTMSVDAPPTFIDTVLLTQGSAAQALVPANGNLGQTWTQIGFSPAGWLSGSSGVGYDNTPAGVNFNPLIGLDVGIPTPSTNEPVSVYSRFEFNFTGNAADLQLLKLRAKYDDGFVAYLNGTEVARRLAPGSVGTPPAFNATASGTFRTDSQSIMFEDIDITSFKNALANGANVLAIHLLNAAATSSDLLMLPELVASVLDPGGPVAAPVYYTLNGSDPRLAGGMLNPDALPYAGPVVLNATTHVSARTLLAGQWSALQDAQFQVEVPLRVSEIQYHPGDRSAAEIAAGFTNDDDFEFIELLNTSSTNSVNLAGMRLVDGIQFTFGAVTLGAGQRTVLVRNLPAFQFRYGNVVPVAGQYGGTPDDIKLSNSGEVVTLVDAGDATIQSFRYDADWYPTTDGLGASLTIVDPLQPLAQWDEATGWRASHATQGTPGADDPPATVLGRHVFYNNSSWDGNSAAANPSDDAAIATDKTALLPGGAATLDNYTSFNKGLNGIMIDVQNLAGTVTAGDFAFKTGNVNATNTWTVLSTAPSVAIRPGAGANGSTRVTLTWLDGVIKKQWLQVKVLANANTGLALDDVFYFGNAIGEAGNTAGDAQVNAADELAARGNPRNIANPAPITFRFDYNRDKQVNAADQLVSRGNSTNLASRLLLITPTAAAAPAAAALADAALFERAVDQALDVLARRSRRW